MEAFGRLRVKRTGVTIHLAVITILGLERHRLVHRLKFRDRLRHGLMKEQTQQRNDSGTRHRF